MSTFTRFAGLRSASGKSTTLGFDFGTLFEGLAKRGQIDVAIVSTEEGFSPLGASGDFFDQDLGVSYSEVIRPIARWNQSENDRVTLVCIESRNPDGHLRGVILAPGANTLSCRRFRHSHSKAPNRSYYYNVSYEAIAFACRHWGAQKIGISHLSGSGEFHEDMATCQAEALAHFCDAEPLVAPDSFVFCGCCITLDHLTGIRRLSAESGLTKHIPIQVVTETVLGATLLHLNWSGAR